MPNVAIYGGPTEDPGNYIGFIQEHDLGFEAFNSGNATLGRFAGLDAAADAIVFGCLGVRPWSNGGDPNTAVSEEPDLQPEQAQEAPMLAAALEYAEWGWDVFPAPPGEKKSYKSAKHSNGAKWGKTRDPEQIRRDFNRWPEANIGLPTGKDNGFWVFETDTPEGHNIDGEASLRKLEAEHGKLPDTLMAISPSGSKHRYFGWPDGVEVRNSASVIGPGIDVRGEGGMVIAPPSVRSDGEYCWLNDLPIADAPQWLIDLVTTPRGNGKGEDKSLPKLEIAEKFKHLRPQRMSEGIGYDDAPSRRLWLAGGSVQHWWQGL